jgi:CRISPR system Cascade subunit CasB
MPRKNWKALVEYLNELYEAKDRGALATLRKGLSKIPRPALEMIPIVYPGLLRMGVAELGYIEKTAFTTCALFSLWHEGSVNEAVRRNEPKSMGASFAMVMMKDAKGTDSIQKRFIALLNAHEADMPVHLKHAVALMRSREVAVNWEDLATALDVWDHPDKPAQLRWARDYWSTIDKQKEPRKEAEKEPSQTLVEDSV